MTRASSNMSASELREVIGHLERPVDILNRRDCIFIEPSDLYHEDGYSEHKLSEAEFQKTLKEEKDIEKEYRS